MFTGKPKKLTLTLVFYVTLALALTAVSDAKGYAAVPAQRRDHANLNRLIKKRSPSPDNLAGILGGPVNGAGNNPPSATPPAATGTPASPAAPSSASSAVAPASATSSASASSASSSSASSSPTSASSTGLLGSILGGLTSTSASSTSSSSSSTTSSTPSAKASSTTLPPTPTQAAQSGSADSVTITSALAAASSSSSAAPATSAGTITRTTLTVLIVIAASIGGVAIIWTVIRKWKFKPSSSFEDRMQPIDWQPTTEESGLPTVRRANSNASSFHSGSAHGGDDNIAGRGGYGSTSDHGHDAPSLVPLPDHDFTAGPANLAPVGGYADLARGPSRGPSPQPQMQEALSRGPTLTKPNYDQYGVPLHHQGGYGNDAYDYNGGMRY